jgi:hypothetical protein
VRETAYPLLHLAHAAVRGHQMIAERIAEHHARVAAEADGRRAAAAATRPAAAPLALEAGNGGAGPAVL